MVTTKIASKTKQQSTAYRSFPIKMIMKLSGSVFQSILTVFSCVIYVLGTYTNAGSSIMNTIEIIVAALFSVDYLWGFSTAKDKRAFMLNGMSIVDLITILPVLINLLNVIIYPELFFIKYFHVC